MATLNELVLQACEDSWTTEWIKGTKNKDNCSGFVNAVCQALCIPLKNANADGIVGAIAGWTKVKDGVEAAQLAEKGTLVLAGLKSGDHTPKTTHGHVVVVISGTLYRGKYPLCWGGSIGSYQSKGTKSVGEVWSTTDRNAVIYRAYTFVDVCAPVTEN